MKKIIIVSLASIFISCFVFFHIFFSPERLFRLHVFPEIPETIKNLKYYKDTNGMHGPFIFAFNVSQQDIQNIIEHNNLIKYEKLPKFVNSLLLVLDKHKLSWWKSSSKLKAMEIYGKESNNSYEPHLKFIFFDKENKVYYLQI